MLRFRRFGLLVVAGLAATLAGTGCVYYAPPPPVYAVEQDQAPATIYPGPPACVPNPYYYCPSYYIAPQPLYVVPAPVYGPVFWFGGRHHHHR